MLCLVPRVLPKFKPRFKFGEVTYKNPEFCPLLIGRSDNSDGNNCQAPRGEYIVSSPLQSQVSPLGTKIHTTFLMYVTCLRPYARPKKNTENYQNV